MGFTPLDGLVMATRPGSVDPGLLLWLEEHAGLPASSLAGELEHGSGLLGLCGTADMREVLAREAQGEADASLALSVYEHRLRSGIAAMAASMDGIDALAFTGGVGARSPEIRRRACARLEFLGISLNRARNEEESGDREISGGGAVVRTFVVAAREDIEIARGVRAVLRPTA
jgi:acetate kinase